MRYQHFFTNQDPEVVERSVKAIKSWLSGKGISAYFTPGNPAVLDIEFDEEGTVWHRIRSGHEICVPFTTTFKYPVQKFKKVKVPVSGFKDFDSNDINLAESIVDCYLSGNCAMFFFYGGDTESLENGADYQISEVLIRKNGELIIPNTLLK